MTWGAVKGVPRGRSSRPLTGPHVSSSSSWERSETPRQRQLSPTGREGTEDEYEPEVSTIIPRLKDANSAEDVRRIVHEEFLHWFDGEDTAGPESAYSRIAQDIWTTFMAQQ